jgi:molecular chaperone Hsp33
MRAGALFDTLSPRELLEWTGEQLVTRLFHEDGVQMLGAKPLAFGCSCSRERVESMLAALGAEEAHAALADGEAVVRCEFCGQSYRFSPEQIGGLFTLGQDVQPAPERTQ